MNLKFPILLFFFVLPLCSAQFFINEVLEPTEEERTAFSKALERLQEDFSWLGVGHVMYGNFSSPDNLEAIVQGGGGDYNLHTEVLLSWEKGKWQPVTLDGNPIVGYFLPDLFFFPGGCRNFTTVDKRDMPTCVGYDWGYVETTDGAKPFHRYVIVEYFDLLSSVNDSVFILYNLSAEYPECSSSGLIYHELYSFYPKDLDSDGDDDLVVELLRYGLEQDACLSGSWPTFKPFPATTELQTLTWLQNESGFIPTEETEEFLQTYDEEIF